MLGNLCNGKIAPSIYYKDDTYCYVNPDDFAEGSVLVKTNSDETLALSDIGRENMTGVYNINRGTAAFERINILTSDEDFSIVEDKSPYSLSLYDRIILDASTVTEGQIIQ